MKRIQIIGTQRSGSNLLRVMLHQHRDICAPHPPHLLKTFYPLLGSYGNLSAGKNYRTLIHDMITWVKLNPVPWEAFNPTADQIETGCTSPSLIQAFKSIYDWEALAEGKTFWICKSMANYQFVENFERDQLIDKYIFLYRDGRDVALSFKDAIVGPKSAYNCALQWEQDQAACLEIAKKLGEKVVLVCYEELIESPLQVLEELFEKIGLTMPSDVLDFPRSEESIHTAEAGEMWKNVARPVIPTNKRKYLTQMTDDEKKIYESIAGHVLYQLGYELHCWPEHTYPAFSVEQIAAFENEEKALRTAALQTAPRHDVDLRRGQHDFHKTLLKTSLVG